ncbi:MAG: glycoside hydrolase family 9 protein [Wujia sp.]
MKRFKKATAVVLSAALMLSMVACGKKTDDKSTPTDAGVASDSDAGDASDETTEFVDDGIWETTESEDSDEQNSKSENGDRIINLDFDNNSTQGFTTYTNGGIFKLTAEDGRLVAAVSSTGTVAHGCQIYWDGFEMLMNCEYTVSFDVSCDIERQLEWRIQINGGDYHAYAGDYIDIGPEVNHVSMDFVMNETSDPAPRFVFNFGKVDAMGEVGAHNIYFDNVVVEIKDNSNAQMIEKIPTPIQVKVNQIGYAPDDTKLAVITSSADTKFKVVNVDTDEVVYVAPLGDSVYSDGVTELTKIADFSCVNKPGTYRVVSNPSGESYEFKIGDNLYDDVYRDVVKMLYLQRCGTEIDSEIAGDFAHDACHTQLATVYGSTETVDVSGGWHDAGDYGRYVVPGAKTVQDLLLAYEDFSVDNDDLGIPESGNGVPDLLDEARYELEWMLKMQDKTSGGVYHKVTAAVFPETVLAVDETADLILAPISYAATGDFAAVMAKASVIYEEYDPEFAEVCLAASKLAYEYMNGIDKPKGYKNPDDIVTGEYPDAYLDDEKIWAAAELYLATGESVYKEAVEYGLENRFLIGLGWADIGGYPLYDLACKAEDEEIRNLAREKLIAKADEVVEACAKEPLGSSLQHDYPWGSNMLVADDGMLLLMANRLSPNPDYELYAQRQRDYIFGVNGTGYCYVTGYGTLSPNSTHHRPSQVLGKTMAGMLVGGPDNDYEDPFAKAVLIGKAPACSYVDNEQSFSCNEITIYWNSPLIYLLSGLK